MMKLIDYQQAQREGGVNSGGGGVTGGIVLPLQSCSWTGGGCKEPRGKLGRALHRAVGQMRGGSQGQDRIFLPGDGRDCSDMMCSRP